jgi:hypothetical protein
MAISVSQHSAGIGSRHGRSEVVFGKAPVGGAETGAHEVSHPPRQAAPGLPARSRKASGMQKA